MPGSDDDFDWPRLEKLLARHEPPWHANCVFFTIAAANTFQTILSSSPKRRSITFGGNFTGQLFVRPVTNQSLLSNQGIMTNTSSGLFVLNRDNVGDLITQEWEASSTSTPAFMVIETLYY